MKRYTNAEILKTDTGKRYYKRLRYPQIPLSSSDIYIITVVGDRLDQISYDYYDTTDDYWILVAANGLKGDSLFITPGTQLRIPTDVTGIKQEFNQINNIV